MNLHGIVRDAITTVNPDMIGQLGISTGYVTDNDGTQLPQYDWYDNQLLQVQPVAQKDLQHLDGLNIQGTMRSVHCYGQREGIARLRSKGGDLLRFGGSTWLIVSVAEQWPDWAKVIVVEQDDD